jgi:hypothetical protein
MPFLELRGRSVAAPAARTAPPSPEEPATEAEDQEDEKKGKHEPERVKAPGGMRVRARRDGGKLPARSDAVRQSEPVLVDAHADDAGDDQKRDDDTRNGLPVYLDLLSTYLYVQSIQKIPMQ